MSASSSSWPAGRAGRRLAPASPRWRLLLLLGLAAAAACLAPGARAAIGDAEIVVNQVDAVLGATQRALARRDEVFQSEVVRTADSSASQLRLRDATALKLGPSSELALERFAEGEPEQKVAVALSRGLLRFSTGTSPKAAYTIRAPGLTAGVRGTVFDVLADEGGASTLVVYAGEAVLRRSDGEPLVVGPCQFVTVAPTGEPALSQPQSAALLGPGDILRILEMQQLLVQEAASEEPSLQDCIDPAAGLQDASGAFAPPAGEPPASPIRHGAVRGSPIGVAGYAAGLSFPVLEVSPPSPFAPFEFWPPSPRSPLVPPPQPAPARIELGPAALPRASGGAAVPVRLLSGPGPVSTAPGGFHAPRREAPSSAENLRPSATVAPEPGGFLLFAGTAALMLLRFRRRH